MSMIDYDARPVTPQIVLVGHRASAVGYSIRDFLSRNGVPYEWIDVDDTERVAGLLTVQETDPDQLPVCILPNGMRLAPSTLEDVAAGLGMMSAPSLSEYDLTIVGAGPAGLAAAVYAASEGLRTLAVEAIAPGGQAGTTSMIENYLGFPQGISGSELATRATAQARRFGAEILLARQLVGLSRDGPGYLARLSDATIVRTQALLVASGVDWRRLEIHGLDDLLGSGVYYGAGPSEAVTCTGCRVAVIGGGNSAGQGRRSLFAVRRSRDPAGSREFPRGIHVTVPDHSGGQAPQRRGSDEHRGGRTGSRPALAGTHRFLDKRRGPVATARRRTLRVHRRRATHP